MTNKPHLKNSDEIDPQKRSALQGDANQGLAKIVAEGGQCINHDTRNSRKAALSKREIMEALSRERFPWEE